MRGLTRGGSGARARRRPRMPMPTEIEAAQMAGDIHGLSDEEKAGDVAAFESARVEIGGLPPPRGYRAFSNPSVPMGWNCQWRRRRSVASRAALVQPSGCAT